MSVSISGILLDPYGQPARFAEIKFITWQGAGDVLTTSNSVFKTSEDGVYAFSVEFGTFTVQVRYSQSNGKFQTIKQKVIVNSATVASTLGALLLFNEPLTPPEIAYVEQLTVECESYRDDCAISAAEAAASAATAESYLPMINGVLPFETFAQLSAYSPPVAQQGNSFKVANDANTALNGYYRWTAGDNYILDDQIANGLVESGNVDAVSGGAVFDVTDFKADLVIGRNKIDEDNATDGGFIQAVNGAIATNANYSYTDYIEILPNTQYTLSASTGNVVQFALYDLGQAYTEGFTATGAVYEFTTGASSVLGRFSILNTSTENMLEVGSEPAPSFTPYQKKIDSDQIGENSIVNDNIVDKTIGQEKFSDDVDFIAKKVGKNKIDEDSATDGGFISSANGNIAAASGFSYTDYIELLPNTQYTLSTVTGGTQQFALYDENKVYTEGFGATVTGELQFTTSVSSVFGRFTLVNSSTGNQLELGAVKTSFVPYEFVVLAIEIERGAFDESYLTDELNAKIGVTNTIIYVDVLGGGDFTSIQNAIDSIGDAAASNTYTLDIAPGTYNEINIIGKDYVNWSGQDRETCIVNGKYPDDTDTATMIANSTIEMSGKLFSIDNLTIYGENCRYAIHEDANRVGERGIINCHVEHLGNAGAEAFHGSVFWVNKNGLGHGFWGGQVLNVLNSKFVGDYLGLFSHTKSSAADLPSYLNADSCDIQTSNLDFQNSLQMNWIFDNNDVYRFKNTRIGQGVVVSGSADFQGKIIFTNCSKTCIDAGAQYVLETDIIETLKNETGATIPKGSSVKYSTSKNNITLSLPSDSELLFVGVVLEDIANNEFGDVKTGGQISANALLISPATTPSFGDTYGISSTSGSLESGATPTIMICEQTGYLRLI